MSSTSLPNFIVFGVQKAGTTSIYNYLKQHPEIYMSPVKETNFFERDWATAPPETLAKKRNGIYTLEQYQQLFAGVTDELAIGEVSPNYLFHHDVAVPLIQQYVPQAKLITVLRNPVDRAYSDYLMHIRDAIDSDAEMSLAEQVRQRPDSSFTLLKGRYYQPLKQFVEAFGANQIQICLYDDLSRNAVQTMQTMYRFLGVDDQFEPDTQQRSQVAKVPKNKTVNSLMRTQNPIRSTAATALKLMMPEAARKQLRDRILALNSTDKSKMPLKAADRALLQDYYRDDILQLQDLINRDLSAWLA
ncbi:MAG: sulfotransferase family protein [Thainema sp.]